LQKVQGKTQLYGQSGQQENGKAMKDDGWEYFRVLLRAAIAVLDNTGKKRTLLLLLFWKD